jgi:hypothetical protein
VQTYDKLVRPVGADISPIVLSAVMLAPALVAGQVSEPAPAFVQSVPAPAQIVAAAPAMVAPGRTYLGSALGAVTGWFRRASSAHDYLFEPQDGVPVDDKARPVDRWRGG